MFHCVNAWDTISLHDCDITKIEHSGKDLILYFTDGFWVGTNNEFNNESYTHKTDIKSRLVIENVGNIDALYAEEIPEKYIYNPLIDAFLQNINSGDWIFEVINEIHGKGKVKYEGYLRMDEAPYNLAICFYLECEDIHYYWNNLLMDRKW